MTPTLSNFPTLDGPVPPPDPAYVVALAAVRNALVGVPPRIATLFRTDAAPRAWGEWLASFLPETRKEHDCRTCRRFIDRYGAVVRVDPETGRTQSAFFGRELYPNSEYAEPFARLRRLATSARITGVLIPEAADFGTAKTHDRKRGGEWTHFCSSTLGYHRSRMETAHAHEARVDEDFGTLSRALAEYSPKIVEQALAIASSGAVDRGEKIVDRLKWLAELHQSRNTVARYSHDAWENLTRLAAATAPQGWCSVRSSVIGPLLDDLAAGKSFEVVKRAHNAKMSPTAYLRPTAAPSAGNVAAANILFDKLELTAALRRRFARLDDVLPHATWVPRPSPSKPAGSGTFDFLLASKSPVPIETRVSTPITFAKFSREVLPTAEEMWVITPQRGAYTSFITASDPSAPAVLQWDRAEARNPMSWYTYPHGSYSVQWNLKVGARVPVTAIVPMPNTWFGGSPKFDHHGAGSMFILQDARDLRGESAGIGLFPEILKSELHAVRTTIEAYSRSSKLEGLDESTASGIAVRTGSTGEVRVSVRAGNVVTEFTIDRWD